MLLPMLLTAAAAEPLWPDLSEPPSVGGGDQDAAVVVAIEDYVSVSDIPGAKDNGLDWYSYFTDGRGIAASRVKLVTDNDATKEGITDAIEAARSQVRSGGTLWFVFIGHGAPSEDGQDGLLVGWDTQQTASSVYARGLMQGEVLDLLESGNQSQTVAILDACFSGQSGADLAGYRPPAHDSQLRPVIEQRCGAQRRNQQAVRRSAARRIPPSVQLPRAGCAVGLGRCR